MGGTGPEVPYDNKLRTQLKDFWRDFWRLAKKPEWEAESLNLPDPLPPSDILAAWENEAKFGTNFTLLDYYKFTREEVEREDGILHQRLSWMLAFQGFLFVAAATLISGFWSSPYHVVFKAVFGIFVAIVGIALSIFSMSGVDAATNSLDAIKADWVSIRKACNVAPYLVPQTFGRKRERIPFAEWMPRVFALAWVAVLLLIAAAALLPASSPQVCYVITPSPSSAIILGGCP